MWLVAKVGPTGDKVWPAGVDLKGLGLERVGQKVSTILVAAATGIVSGFGDVAGWDSDGFGRGLVAKIGPTGDTVWRAGVGLWELGLDWLAKGGRQSLSRPRQGLSAIFGMLRAGIRVVLSWGSLSGLILSSDKVWRAVVDLAGHRLEKCQKELTICVAAATGIVSHFEDVAAEIRVVLRGGSVPGLIPRVTKFGGRVLI